MEKYAIIPNNKKQESKNHNSKTKINFAEQPFGLKNNILKLN